MTLPSLLASMLFYVNTPVIDMREQPNDNAEIVSQAYYTEQETLKKGAELPPATKVAGFRSVDSMNKKYQIIYINGPSSSGKTTLARLLQQELDPPFLHIGIDRVIGMMPEKLNNWEGAPAPLGFSWKSSFDDTGHPMHEIQLGPFAKKMSDTLKEIVLTLAKSDHYVIIDDVAFGKQDVDKWRAALKDYNVLWVGIHTPLPLLEQREKQRGDRMIGSARAQYIQVHKDVVYDLEFDTSKDSSEKIVHNIKKKLQNL